MKHRHPPTITKAGAVAAICLASVSTASAEPRCQYGILDLTANGGINPNTGNPWQVGDRYRLAFHTAGTIPATSNDPAVYDDFATAQAQQNPALLNSTGWTAMVWVNTDGSMNQGVSPVSSPLDRSGTADRTGGPGEGGAGAPVYAMDGRTAIARNNDDIYDDWSNPFDGDAVVRLAVGTTHDDSNGVPVIASNNVHYSPFLDQFGLGDTADVHGLDVWTGGLASAINPLGDTPDDVLANWGSSNANTPGPRLQSLPIRQYDPPVGLRDLGTAHDRRRW
jgi:hypothetical protein